ncbi:uncharacterized protein LOC129598717 [Paramacrobiotus metropolitanus]|uniref:uncharacterized protein LOC129598717 n=1 Tax=Paramacrobiotus metropolitanus TaxID=2943436 RepID=UPI0024463BB3|nr:uncharacterized protein LOC129598717 [Paramacrobiotus metropolitanus]XP_055352722.1 uncharacterized protein LOC129598717 [Paramacrobiotus metropolitanus]
MEDIDFYEDEPVTPTFRGESSGSSKDITILLLGETGVGKSTFINAFANYLCHENMQDALQNVICLIPSYFTHSDPQTFKTTLVTLGKPDSNEKTGGESGTQSPKCYTFETGEGTVRLIDTPGIGDTDGTNMRNLLAFISQYKEINAICILLKPNSARVSVVFQYCIFELLKNLNKTASQNILFLFTNSRSTFYAPGDTAPTLTKILDTIKNRPPHVSIQFGPQNVYCFDNEAFRFLMAKAPPNNLRFSAENERDYGASWERGVTTCQAMMRYIRELPPHPVEDMISVSNARISIQALTQPLAEISMQIAESVRLCEIQKKRVKEFQGNIEELRKELFTPAVDIITTPLAHPRTVCGHADCCETVNVNGVKKTHYKSVCHNHCYLANDDSNVLGNKGLLDCKAFNKYVNIGETARYRPDSFHPDNELSVGEDGLVEGFTAEREKSENCFQCGHSYQVHLHIESVTERRNIKVRDEAKQSRINSDEEKKRVQEAMVRDLEKTIAQWKKENEEINRCLSIFACFLSHNALTPFNDAYEDYLKYLIENHKQSHSAEIRANALHLENSLQHYRQEKDTFAKAYAQRKSGADISAKAVTQAVESLFKLEKSGPKIKNFLELMKEVRKAAHAEHAEVKVETSRPGIRSRLKRWIFG